MDTSRLGTKEMGEQRRRWNWGDPPLPLGQFAPAWCAKRRIVSLTGENRLNSQWAGPWTVPFIQNFCWNIEYAWHYSCAISHENLISKARKRKPFMEMNSPHPPGQDRRNKNRFLNHKNAKVNSNRGENSPWGGWFAIWWDDSHIWWGESPH